MVFFVDVYDLLFFDTVRIFNFSDWDVTKEFTETFDEGMMGW